MCHRLDCPPRRKLAVRQRSEAASGLPARSAGGFNISRLNTNSFIVGAG